MMWENAHNFLYKATKRMQWSWSLFHHSSFEILISKRRGVSSPTRNNKPIQSYWIIYWLWVIDGKHLNNIYNCLKTQVSKLGWSPTPPGCNGWVFYWEHPKARVLSSWWSRMHPEGMGITIKKIMAFLRNLMSCKWTFSKRVKRTRKPEYQAVNRHRWRDVKHRSTASICIMDLIIPSTMIRWRIQLKNLRDHFLCLVPKTAWQCQESWTFCSSTKAKIRKWQECHKVIKSVTNKHFKWYIIPSNMFTQTSTLNSFQSQAPLPWVLSW